MSLEISRHPPEATWVAAVHRSAEDFTPLGAGIVIDERRVLTCTHVVMADGQPREPLWVAFPKADQATDRRLRVADLRSSKVVYDLTIMEFDEPLPTDVAAAKLRCPRPADLVGRPWWAFGFAGGHAIGNSADGLVGTALAYGFVRLDTESRYSVQPGFSGGGLWSPDYAAVVGIVGMANERGDGQAITFHQADLCFPDDKLRRLADWSAEQAGEIALSAWGWTLDDDPEAGRHWRPRARGVSRDSDRGFRFRGRTAALTAVTRWLDRAHPDRRALVVTGSPGVGKSALLGRIVTTADPLVRATLPADGVAAATERSVACAVHAKGKTGHEVATEIARAASAALPERLEDLAPAIREALTERGGSRFNVIVDALDEAVTAAEAREIVTRIVLPLVETCSDVGAQVVVGSRRRDDEGDLLQVFGNALVSIDLDESTYFSLEDLEAYALASLRLQGAERPDNPYSRQEIALPVARRIAQLSDRNFLVAGMTALSHGLHDRAPADPSELSFTAKVDDALHAYLRRLEPVAGIPAALAMTALAFAEAPGFTLGLWKIAIEAMTGRRLQETRLAEFARSSAANFLVESARTGTTRIFRLFHQALDDALRGARAQLIPPIDDERAIFRAFLSSGRQRDWARVPPYLLRSLPGHAARADTLDELLLCDEFLLHADLARLNPLADRAKTEAGQARARLLWLTSYAISATPDVRMALFSITEVLEGVGGSFQAMAGVPYRARWAWAIPRSERAVLEGHTDSVTGLCAFTLKGRPLLASAADDGTVRVWDPSTGTQEHILKGHAGCVHSVCAFTLAGRVLLASAGSDGTVRLWNPNTGTLEQTLEGHTDWVTSVCAFDCDGRTLLASGSSDGTLRLWDPATGVLEQVMRRHTGHIYAICPFPSAGRTLLASAGADGTVRIWDPGAREHENTLRGHYGRVHSVCSFVSAGRTILASGDAFGVLRVWDPETGRQLYSRRSHFGGVQSVCGLEAGGRAMICSAGDDKVVHIWDASTGTRERVLEGHGGKIYALCSYTSGERTLLASGGDRDAMVRVWDATTGTQGHQMKGHGWGVRSISALESGDRTLVVSAGDDGTARIWDARTGELTCHIDGTPASIHAVCAFASEGRALIATADDRGTVQIHDATTGTPERTLDDRFAGIQAMSSFDAEGRSMLAIRDFQTVRVYDPITGIAGPVLTSPMGSFYDMCTFTSAERTLLAVSGYRTVRIWDPTTGSEGWAWQGHEGGVQSVCAFESEGRALLATAGDDGVIQIWDATTGNPERTLDDRAEGIRSACAFTHADQPYLAVCADRTVRITSIAGAGPVQTIPVHHTAHTIQCVGDLLVVALSAGLLAIEVRSGIMSSV